jgi:hypothetical protein
MAAPFHKDVALLPTEVLLLPDNTSTCRRTLKPRPWTRPRLLGCALESLDVSPVGVTRATPRYDATGDAATTTELKRAANVPSRLTHFSMVTLAPTPPTFFRRPAQDFGRPRLVQRREKGGAACPSRARMAGTTGPRCLLSSGLRQMGRRRLSFDGVFENGSTIFDRGADPRKSRRDKSLYARIALRTHLESLHDTSSIGHDITIT